MEEQLASFVGRTKGDAVMIETQLFASFSHSTTERVGNSVIIRKLFRNSEIVRQLCEKPLYFCLHYHGLC